MSYEPFDIIAQEEALAEKSDANRLAEQTAKEDLKFVMNDVRGRRFMWRFLEGAGIYRSSFVADSATIYFLEGERNAGLKMLAKIQQVTPEGFILMQQEYMKHE